MEHAAAVTPVAPHDLGFRYRVRKGGEVVIYHHGRLAATLRGAAADAFLTVVGDELGAEAQQTMARRTGNYKRGHEREARRHPRRG